MAIHGLYLMESLFNFVEFSNGNSIDEKNAQIKCTENVSVHSKKGVKSNEKKDSMFIFPGRDTED